MKCVFTWQPEPHLQLYFKSKINDAIELVFVDKKDVDGIKEAAKDATIIAGWVINDSILNTAKNLKYIFYPGAGVQHYKQSLITLMQQKGIIFTNSHSNSYATAQHACAMLLSLCNKIVLHHSFLKDGKWRTGDKEAKSISLRKKHIGLLGFGAIGKFVFKMLQGFDCSFSAFKNSNNIDETYINKIALFSNESGNLNSFLKQIDILICSLPQTPTTVELLNSSNIGFLKDDALIVNVGRGAVIEEEALYNALSEQKIAGAAIDVWYNYKPEKNKASQKFPFNYPFNKLENVVLSPHRGASPMDDPYRFEELVYNINELVKPNPKIINIINFGRGY